MHCHLGDTASYLALLNDLAAGEKEIARAGASRRRDETARDLAELRRGDVIEVPTGRRAGLAVILDPGVATDGSARPLVVTAGSWAGRLTVADFRGPVPSSRPAATRQVHRPPLAEGPPGRRLRARRRPGSRRPAAASAANRSRKST